ncbi:DUF2865 domain-containing protein [Brucella intermedia]|uniref:DUF2865 domain-containing protein n=1 Tax=Brucella intermedia TaxID=94625 RepID=UPI00178C20F8|nr:DUF2865 domain-containing protein [Brucella intermedia]
MGFNGVVVTKSFALLLLIGLICYPQLAAASCTRAAGAADLMTQRQLSALRAMERSRGCKGGDERGGFFNPCRDLAQRIAEIQQQLASSSLSSRACAEQPAAPQTAKVKLDRPKTSSVTTTGKPWVPGGVKGALTYCVRLSDGYLFPAPHSQFQKSDNVTETLAQCRFICQGENVDLYILNDPNGETADMVSVSNGKPYIELPTAYAYQGGSDFKKCDWAGYVNKISELRANSKGSRAFKNVVVPMPDTRPTRNDEVAISTTSFAPMSDRNVRVIGPAFIFDEDAAQAKSATY